jgi:purine nucleoside permease
MAMRALTGAAALLLVALPIGAASANDTFPVRVVVVTTFQPGEDTGNEPGEFRNWVEQFPLPVTIPFPHGDRHLRYNPDKQVLGIVTGEGTAHAAASIMGLGMDPRFDLRKSYWVVAGIAGVDPNQASVGSAAWANYVVDGDLAYEIDAREIPSDWSTGYVPLGRSRPYQQPVPPANSINGDQVYHLNSGLVNWAYHLTADIKIPDDATLQQVRAGYPSYPNAQKPPFVLRGDDLASSTFWVGDLFNTWAENWVSYWTHGKGNFVMTLEEDSGVFQALTFLTNAERADVNRALVLRTASDYSVQPEGQTPAQFLASENGGGLTGFIESLNAAYQVASPVVNELATHWDNYADQPPSADP